jgi:hypothetical protein
MRKMQRLTWLIVLLPLTFLALATNLCGQTKVLKAQVWGIKGSATYGPAGEVGQRLNPGTVLPVGSIIQTAPGSAVDLHLGKDKGLLRITENTTLILEKLDLMQPGTSNTVEVQLQLQAGSILADVKRLLPGSKYQVKVSNGLVGIRDGQFRINSQGFVVLLNGGLAVVHIPSVGEPHPYTLTAPPAVYFSPLEGVKEAPPPLAQEVQKQLNARLRVP